jgi:hypothetical protein
MVARGEAKERVRFFVTNLGKDRWILRYPWLAKFNPGINWMEAEVQGPKTWIETLVKGSMTQKEYLRHVQQVAIAQLEEGNELIMTIWRLAPEPMDINKTTLAQQMVEKAYDTSKVNTEETIPAVFKRHWRVFSEEQARQLPPHRPWDHQINLKPNAPDVINSKTLPTLKGWTKAPKWVPGW